MKPRNNWHLVTGVDLHKLPYGDKVHYFHLMHSISIQTYKCRQILVFHPVSRVTHALVSPWTGRLLRPPGVCVNPNTDQKKQWTPTTWEVCHGQGRRTLF